MPDQAGDVEMVQAAEPEPPPPPPREAARPRPPVVASRPPTADRIPRPTAEPPAAANGDEVEPSEVDAILNSLKSGDVVFDSPTHLFIEETKIIEVTLVPPGLPVPELREGEVVAEALISNRMQATLTGQGFLIEALTPEVQAVSERTPTMWRWQVTPTKTGTQSLHLSLLAIIEVEGDDTPFVVRTFSRDIEVNITIQQKVFGFLGNNWKWLWTAIFIPIIGYLLKKRSEKRKKNKSNGDKQ